MAVEAVTTNSDSECATLAALSQTSIVEEFPRFRAYLISPFKRQESLIEWEYMRLLGYL